MRDLSHAFEMTWRFLVGLPASLGMTKVAALENACHSDDSREEESLAVGVVSRDSSRSTKGLGSE